MDQAHFANTFFEKELASRREAPLTEWMRSHPSILQLQYLPLLYRHPGDSVLLLDPPPAPYLRFLERHNIETVRLEYLDRPRPLSLHLWAPSRAVAAWAERHRCKTDLHDWDRVREVHSKLFSFAAAPQIPGSRLLQTADEAAEWVASIPGPKVLKRAFGMAGSGHLFLDRELPPRASVLFEQGEVLLGEPWVKRTFDFSTQWKVGSEIEYVGATVLETSERGVYLGTKAGDEEQLFKGHERALSEHLEQTRPILKTIQALGFAGHLGIDAFVYEWKGERRLRAVSEINARKTFGWAALQIQKLHGPKKVLHLRYEKTDGEGFLPTALGKQVFERQLLLHWT